MPRTPATSPRPSRGRHSTTWRISRERSSRPGPRHRRRDGSDDPQPRPDGPRVMREPKRPPRPRKIIAYLATSADGYIARRDGGIEWLDRPRPPGNYGMGKFFKSIDTILLGRKTYEVALGLTGGKGVGSGKRVKNYVFSRRPPKSHTPDVEFVREPLARFAKRLRATPGRDVWMMGGAGLIGSFLDAGEIDEFVIHVV